jgi:hypothetical protein
MAPHLRSPRFNFRVLTVFALVAIPLAAIGATVVLGAGQYQFRQAFGLQLSQVAEHTAAAVDAYVFRRIIDVTMMGRIPTLRQASATASTQPLDAERVKRLDAEWQATRKVPAELAGILTNEASTLLRDTTRHDPIYREILLADRSGRLVAASNVTSDYYQGDEAWWRDAFNDGEQGRVSLTDVQWDESAKTLALDLAVPVPGLAGERPAGVLLVVADVREMLAAVAGLEFGRTGAALLIRPDGSIVLSRDAIGPEARFFAAALLQERLQALKKGPAQFRTSFAATAGDGTRHLIGVAPSQLSASYPALTWLVAVTQAEDELFAPVRTQVTSLLLVIAIAVASVLILSLAFSMWLSAPAVETGMQLVEHPKVHRVAEDDEAA